MRLVKLASGDHEYYVNPEAVAYVKPIPNQGVAQLMFSNGRSLDVNIDEGYEALLKEARTTVQGGDSLRKRRLLVAPAGFVNFWTAYPKKVGYGAALTTWKAMDLDERLEQTIVAAVLRQRTWRQWKEGFIPNPATWLNQTRWLDEQPDATKQSTADTARSLIEGAA